MVHVSSAPAPAAAIPGFRQLELIHQSGPRAIYRAVRETDAEAVVLKTLLSPYPRSRDVAELKREFQIARRLDVDGVIRMHRLVTYGAGNLAIEMETFGVSLADLMAGRGRQPLSLDAFFAIAIELAHILGRVHERGVVHKDVVPRNVLIEPRSAALRLIDFGISSELSRERQDVTLSRRLQGSLPYISPEQTGRMNRELDYRSDYYSLGVTFFELLTGRTPFAAGHALEWVHQHISQPPPSVHDLNSEVPEPLSAVVAKLISKNAEERYQSTPGLVADLEYCRWQRDRWGAISPFPLGRTDVSRRFEIPQKLYGRELELERLRGLFGEVTRGPTALCLVSGYAGVGKSALVNELSKSIAGKMGYMIQGKFEQLQRNSAYAAIAFAFRSLIQQLLCEAEGRLEAWRQELDRALGSSGQLIIDLVPELQLIIGPQPAVPTLPPTEAQNRFQLVFLNFVKVFADERHPLVIFLDDLQWSDVPTLNLIHRLVTARDLGHLLVIGAYRSNAVGPGHPLSIALEQVRKTRAITEIELQPLTRSDVTRLVADTVRTDVDRAEPLGALIYNKAEGNPFFVGELLTRLHEEGAIRFDLGSGGWSWDAARVRGAPASRNVVDFMEAKLRRLPGATQQVLKLAACIGSTFDLKTLSIIGERSMEQTSAELSEALRLHIVVPLSETYKYAGLEPVTEADGSKEGGGDDVDAVNPTYRFHHDRVQQAAYALIDADRKQAVHLSVGRLILRHSTDAEIAERLIDIVAHLNAGRTLIDDPGERRDLARLNLEAGIKASHSSAYAYALDLLDTGLDLLAGEAWDTEPDLALALHREAQQCAYLTGDYDKADSLAETMLRRARTPLEGAQVLAARTRQYATIGKMGESIRTAFDGLAMLGIDLVEEPGGEHIAAELAEVEGNLAGRRIMDLIDAPKVADPQALIAIRILMEVFPAAFLSGSGALFPYLVLKSVNLSLRHGSSPESAFAYGAYGMLLCGSLNDPALGYQYGRLAVAMNERFDDLALRARIIYVYAMFIHHWSNHWSSMTPWFLKGIEAGYQSGDLLYLAYSAQDCIIWDPKLDIDSAVREQRRYLTIVRDCEYQDSLDSGTLFLQMLLNFRGLTAGPHSLNDESFDEQRCLAGMRQRRFMTGIANYHIYKAEIHFFYDDYDGAFEHVQVQDNMIASSMSLPQLVRFYIIAFLTHAARYRRMDEEERKRTDERLHRDLEKMSSWAAICPDNFEHLRLVMEAELQRLGGRVTEALVLYERAIAAAQASEFRRDEAQANELAGKCLLEAGWPKAAEGYIRTACYLYDRWGAHRKVQDLKSQHPGWFEWSASSARAAPTGRSLAGTVASIDATALDLSSVIKASQTISGEIVLDQLWKTTLHILLENAGAQHGAFVTRQGDRLTILAEGRAGEAATRPAAGAAVSGGEGPQLPVSMVHSVFRTAAPLVVDDATASARFAEDPYIVRHRPKSVICVPILRRGQVGGVIYMENNLTTAAFTEERVEVIRLLAAQATISMENAQLYADQVRLVEAQERFVPRQFLESLGHRDIARVRLGEYVAREMSVMFSDLREFTPLAERLGPAAMIDLLNRYFSALGRPVAETGGFIESYKGDAIMALFGPPPDRVLEAGVGMWRALEAFNAASLARGGPVLRMAVGANTGPLVLGTVGGHDRLTCSVVGDTVNVASRMEQLSRAYGARLLIAQGTFDALSDPQRWSIRMVDRIAIKGKEQPTALYEVLDAETPERRAAKEATREQLAAGMALYFDGAFARAQELFRAAMALDPEDVVPAMFAERSATAGAPRDMP